MRPTRTSTGKDSGDDGLSRRELLSLGVIGGGLLLAGCASRGNGVGTGMMGGRRGPMMTAPTPSTGVPDAGQQLVEPAVLASRDGVLDVDLVAAPVMLEWGSQQRWALAYNGTVPGPTLRVRPGDVVRVRLVNQLDEPTNLHTHGLHVSPSGSSDDPFVMVEPGGTHRYEYHVPVDHAASTLWYHPHHHGRVAAQVAAGMAGVLVVDDGRPPALLTDARERVLVLSDPRIGTTSAVTEISAMEAMAGRYGDVALVNGQRTPTLVATAGTVERWRVVNASASRAYRLRLAGMAWRQVGGDGGLLDEARAVDDITLAPGERIEMAVAVTGAGATLTDTAAGTAGTGAMGGGMMGASGMMGGARGAASGAADLMVVTVSGSGTPPPVEGHLTDVERLAAVPVDGSRRLTLGMGMGMIGGGSNQFTIDGRAFDAARTDTTARLGTVEEWTVVNTSPMDHPFHLHVWPFQVIEASDGRTVPLGWKDVAVVPAGGWIRLRVRFADFPGRTVYHCHILDHEDRGMMGVIDVT